MAARKLAVPDLDTKINRLKQHYDSIATAVETGELSPEVFASSTTMLIAHALVSIADQLDNISERMRD